MRKTTIMLLLLAFAAGLAAQVPRLVVPIGHTDRVTSVAFSPDGKQALTGSRDGTAKLWDLSGKELRAFAGHAEGVSSVAFSPDGKQALTGSEDGTAKLWDLSGRELQAFVGHAYGVSSVAFSPDGKQALTGSMDGTAKLWDLSGRVLQAFDGHAEGVNSVAFSPDGKQALMGSADGTAKLWDLSGKELQAFVGHAYSVSSVAFSPDGKQALTGSMDGTAKLWDLSGRELQAFVGHGNWVLSVAFSPNGKQVLTGSEDGTAKLWGLSGRELQVFVGHTDFVTSVAFSPNGKQALTGSRDKTAKLWGLSGREVQAFDGHTEGVSSVAFSPDGKQALTGSEDGTAKLWDLSGRELQAFVGHAYGVSSVAFSPDGKQALTGSADGTAKLWDLSGKELQVFVGHASSVSSVAFSPDGKQVLTGSEDKTAKLWDLSGRELLAFVGHTNWVLSVAFSPDGKQALTGGLDNTTKLWYPHSGQVLATLIALDSVDWVVTTSSGLFDASPGAMNLMYFVVGVEAIDLEQLKERYYEPGLLQKLLGFSDEPIRSVEGLDTIALYPAVSLQLDTPTNQLQIELIPRNGGMGKVSVFINGKEIIENANPYLGAARQEKTSLPPIVLGKYARYFLRDSLNTVTVRAYNEAGWLKSPAHTVTCRPRFARSKGTGGDMPSFPVFQPARDPALYAIIAGTANYAGTKLDLKFPGKDAEAMASAIRQAGGQLFGADSVVVRLLTTDTTNVGLHPTKANIKAVFEDFKAKAKAEDVLLVYLSGHGVTYGDAERAQFYYLTQDISSEDLSDEAVRSTRAISSGELTKWINDIPAQKQVMILDACNSGKVVEALESGTKSLNSTQIRALDRMKDRTGMFVLAGSAADKVSYEASQYGQGLLTYKVLEAMSGLRLKENKYVDVALLFEYARDEVPKLAESIGGIQTPTMLTPSGGSIDIGIVNEQVHIRLAPKKPVFVRNVFLEEVAFYDSLKIGSLLESQLQDITARGAQASLIYVDVPEYQNAYSIKGFYRVEKGGQVSLKARLFKGQTALGPIAAQGRADQLDELAAKILGQALKISGDK